MNTRAVVPAIFIKDGKLDFEDITVTDQWSQDITEMVEILGAFGELLVHDVVITIPTSQPASKRHIQAKPKDTSGTL